MERVIARLNKQVFLVLICEYESANVCGVEISVSSYSCTGREDKILSFDWAASFLSSYINIPFSFHHWHFMHIALMAA